MTLRVIGLPGPFAGDEAEEDGSADEVAKDEAFEVCDSESTGIEMESPAVDTSVVVGAGGVARDDRDTVVGAGAGATVATGEKDETVTTGDVVVVGPKPEAVAKMTTPLDVQLKVTGLVSLARLVSPGLPNSLAVAKMTVPSEVQLNIIAGA